jgi:aminomethyltransferase
MLKRVAPFFKSRNPLLTQGVRKYATAGQLKKTALYNFHVEKGAKMVPFCGWMMPLTYGKDGTIKPHLHCRQAAALFDVSHMGQLKFTGKDRFDFLESLVPGNLKDLKVGQSRLTQLTNEKGGIMDDTIITRMEDHLFEVVNAGCFEQDMVYFNKHLQEWQSQGKDVQIENLSLKNSLVALQGPKAAEILQKFVKEDLSNLGFMNCMNTVICGAPAIVTRSGYTGEDGFEISLPHEYITEFCEKLCESPDVMLAGLGPRDTLRLEAGLCLMGDDMSPEITPVEAGLSWTIGKRRREQGGFPGADVILKQLKEGVTKTKIGFEVQETSGIARKGYKIFTKDGEEIGIVTSGTRTPCVEKPIGLGYVKTEHSKVGTEVMIEVRKKLYPAKIAQLPFVKTNFYKKK